MQAVAEWNGKSASDLLVMERLDRDLFRNHFNQRNANGVLFGGQVLAQSLKAASITVDEVGHERGLHSMHGYFLRAGKADASVIYQVERTRDGGRFSTRRVTAIQGGEPIFHMECGYHAAEEGFDHQTALPRNIPRPHELLTLAELAEIYSDRLPDWLRGRWVMEDRPIDVKPVNPESFLHVEGAAARRSIWMRLRNSVSSTPVDQACLLAYLSDYWLAGTAALPHSFPNVSPTLFIASLDHAMWFHRPARLDGWMLFETESPSAQNGRGLSRALIYGEDGSLIASTAQEALLRKRRPTS